MMCSEVRGVRIDRSVPVSFCELQPGAPAGFDVFMRSLPVLMREHPAGMIVGDNEWAAPSSIPVASRCAKPC